LSRGRILIVGFGAFPRVPRNPSGILARRIAASPRLRRVLGEAPHCLILRTAYAALDAQLAPALAEGPDAILMIGVAMRARRIRVEWFSRNRVSTLFPDADGWRPPFVSLTRGAPAQRRSLPAARALVALRFAGLDAAASRDAGRYLCNASYDRALQANRRALFLHIPRLPDPARKGRLVLKRRLRPIASWTDAFVDVAIDLLAARAGEGA
jgi:pyroglutamyl-peptidase